MDIDELVQAVQSLNAEDAFRARLTLEQWRMLSPYLTRHEIRAGDLLIKQGDTDRTMYLLEQGSLQVFVTGGPPGANRIAILRAGSVVGEPGLFSDGPRTGQRRSDDAVHRLGAARAAPRRAGAALAGARLEVLRAAGGVMAAAHARQPGAADADLLAAGKLYSAAQP